MTTYDLFQSSTIGLHYCGMAADKNKKREGDPKLAKRMRACVEYSGKTQLEIAGDVGVTPQSVTKWLKMGYLAKHNIPNFCKSCGVDIEWFLTGEGKLKPALSPSAVMVDSRRMFHELSDEEVLALMAETISPDRMLDLIGAMARLISQSGPGKSTST